MKVQIDMVKFGAKPTERQAAAIKYENGTITTSELLQKITDESAALSAQALHRIELIKAQYELKNL